MGKISKFFVLLAVTFSSFVFAMDPPAGFSGAPDSTPNATQPVNSGRFIAITRGLSSLGDTADQTINLSIRVPNNGTQTDIEILMFDGDIGGTWDVLGPDTMKFELFPDPDLVANTTGALASKDAALLDDNAWSDLFGPIALSNDALSPDGQFFNYHLVGSWADPSAVIDENNLFKVASNGEVFLLTGSSIGYFAYAPGDPIVPPTAYDGRITFNVLIPDEGSAQDVCSITIYDGDADRDDDTDDANSPDFPPFQTSPITKAQGVNPGNPADDGSVINPLTISPSVSFRVNGPASSPIVVPGPNDPPLNVSGDREWEKTTIYSTSPLCQINNPIPADADLTVPELVAGEAYEIEVFGLDGRNTIFFNIDKEVSFNDTETCPTGDLGFESKSDGSLFMVGDIVTDQIPGVIVSTENAGGLPAMIFDSFVPTGGDPDLGSPSQDCATTFAGPGVGVAGAPSNCFSPEGDLPSFLGKILIISEDGDQSDPDDRAAGGTFVFDFEVETDIDTVSLLDIEENGGVIEAFDSSGDLLLTTAIPANGDNSYQAIEFIVFGVKTLKVTLEGSGAVAGVTFCPDCIPRNGEEEDEEGNFCPVICEECEDGFKQIELKLISDSNNRQDSQERVRVYQGTGNGTTINKDGPALFDSSVDTLNGVSNGDSFTVSDIDPEGNDLIVTVQGPNHKNEYIKAKVPIKCTLKIGSEHSVSQWIVLKVTDANLGEGVLMCPMDPSEDPEGCTPGYWKQSQHFGSWTDYQVSDIFRSVFNKGSSKRSLLTTLRLNKGGKLSYDKHAVAALLNASNPDVNYFMETQEVLDSVKQTYSQVFSSPKSQRKALWNAAKDIFEQQNEMGCPLGNNP